jgi:anti-sigma regulatory factor (Ser/Thr protein kinase)
MRGATAFFSLIDDPSRVAEGRRMATLLAEGEGLPPEAVAKAAIVASELGSNLLKHAKRGELHVSGLSGRGARGLEIVSIDRGPGMANVQDSIRDGHSTTGTSGTGLGAVRRLSDEFEILSEPGKGTILVSQILGKDRGEGSPAFRLGLAERPVSGETVSGDSWAVRLRDDAALLMLADGLGHGMFAHEASRAAAEAFSQSAEESPAKLLQVMHGALRGTRGAAIAVARVEFGAARVRFAGLGNIAGSVISDGKLHAMVSHNGTAGYEARQFREFVYPWTKDSVIVLHSDGLSASWNPAAFPGLLRQHPSMIGALLYREFARERDDACILVGRKA